MNEMVVKQSKFRVYGFIDGKRFDEVFDSVAQWKQEKKLIQRHAALDVRGMCSVEVAA